MGVRRFGWLGHRARAGRPAVRRLGHRPRASRAAVRRLEHLARAGRPAVAVGAAVLGTVALVAAPAQAAPASRLWAWGDGDLGIASGGVRVEAVPVHGLGTSPVRQVVSGNDFGPVLALLANGTVWAWGSGPLGNGEPATESRLTGVTSIVAGGDAVYALRGDGTVWAWGDGEGGQLGDGAMASSDVPVRVSLADQVTQLASQCGTGYALTGGWRVFAWGGNAHGQLGDGTRTNSATPVLVRRVQDADSVTAGCVDAYAIVGRARTVLAWGQGDQGEMGDGHTATRPLPVTVADLSGVTQVSVGYFSTYAVRDDGMAWDDGTAWA
jgi:alpha-tubulin suppressor-like RCC1 family protein